MGSITAMHLRIVGIGLAALLAGCVSKPPANPEDLCAIFKEKPGWYREAKDAELRWKVPVSVMMAVMNKESSYIANARPPRRMLLGIIPWKRESTAYGFAQATDEAWSDYLRETGDRFRSRDNFGDAVDFVGWYLNRSHRHLNIPVNDARALYLTYYAGMGGYSRGNVAEQRLAQGCRLPGGREEQPLLPSIGELPGTQTPRLGILLGRRAKGTSVAPQGRPLRFDSLCAGFASGPAPPSLTARPSGPLWSPVPKTTRCGSTKHGRPQGSPLRDV